jgi:hypothetical protein
MVGIIMETAGLRFPFYVKVHKYTYEKRRLDRRARVQKHLGHP